MTNQISIRLIVAGGRGFDDYPLLKNHLDEFLRINPEFEVICGEAKGADTFGKVWANKNKIDVKSFPADWETNGKSAGRIRNKQMANYATHLIAFWDNKSSGTGHMIRIAKEKGLITKIIWY